MDRGLPAGSESAFNAGYPGSVPVLQRSPGEGNGNPLQYSCLENSMDRGDWQATVSCSYRGCKESDRTERLTYNVDKLKTLGGQSWVSFTSWRFYQLVSIREKPLMLLAGRGGKEQFETWSMLSFPTSSSLKRNLSKALSAGVLSEAN